MLLIAPSPNVLPPRFRSANTELLFRSSAPPAAAVITQRFYRRCQKNKVRVLYPVSIFFCLYLLISFVFINFIWLSFKILVTGWTQMETIKQLVVKSGYTRQVTKGLLTGMQTTRYQSSKASMTYEEFSQYRRRTLQFVTTL